MDKFKIQTKMGNHYIICHMMKNAGELLHIKLKRFQILKSDHEEAYTRLLLHALHASTEGCSEVLLVCEDMDVMIVALSCCKSIPVPIYQKRGNQNLVNLTKIKEMLSSEISETLPGLHAFTGCEFLCWKREIICPRYRKERCRLSPNAFSELGCVMFVSDDLFDKL